MEGALPWRASRLSYDLGIPVLRSCAEETSPLTFWENRWDRQKGLSSLDATCKERAHADLPIVRVERALHWCLPPHHTPQSEWGKHPGPACSIPQPGMRSGPTSLWEKMQRQTVGLGWR